MSVIRPLAAALGALVAAGALVVGGTYVLQPGYVDVSPVVLPADTPPGPAVPQPEPLMPTGSKPPPIVDGPGGHGRQTTTCVNPGNPQGWCWYEGWSFAQKGVCIESAIPGAPLAAVAALYRVKTIAVYVRFTEGGCAASGFPASQRVAFEKYTADDLAGAMKNACAYTQAANYGALTAVKIRVNVTAPKRTYCGGEPEWSDLFGHELGHAFGLSHNQPAYTSIMRDGHTTDAADQYRLGVVYYSRPAFDPAKRAALSTASAGSPATALDACDDDPNQCVLPSCVTAGNPAGVCWYDGFQFPNRTICLQSGPSSMWTAAQAEQHLNWVAYSWAVNGPRIYVRTVPGACAAAGFDARHTVKFVPYVVDDGHCGLSYSMGVGYAENLVTIYMGPDPHNRCRRNTSEVWAHEFGHQLGLTHYAESASLMQFGTYRSSVDAWKMANLYTGNPCGDPLYAGCV